MDQARLWRLFLGNIFLGLIDTQTIDLILIIMQKTVVDNISGTAGLSGQSATLRSPLKSSEWGGDDPIRLCPDAHMDRSHQYLHPTQYPFPSQCARMFDDDVHMSAVHNPGAGCPIRRPSDLSAPHICSRSQCPGFHCTAL